MTDEANSDAQDADAPDAEAPGAEVEDALTPPQQCVRMSEVRAGIDHLDRQLVQLIAQRTRYIEAAGRIKTDIDEVRLEWRIEEVVAKVLRAAAAADLPASIAEPVWRELVDRSIAHEMEVWRAVRSAKKGD